MPRPPEIDDDAPLPAKLRFAIAHKRLLGFEYNARLRVGEPHDFGAMDGATRIGSTCRGTPFSRGSGRPCM